VMSWKTGELDAFLKANPTEHDLRKIFEGVPFKDGAQIKTDFDKYVKERQQQVRILRGLFYVWAIVIPLCVAIVEFFMPQWLALIVLGYSFWKAWREWLKLTGRTQPSLGEKEKSEKQNKMEHYFYHCERNPLGFARLKVENF
jgi:hypothetical protein